ncbi:Hypothetical protein I595_2419 [Croceitalea dokdonensis DOKDO 023]|uniref:Uncharacterized protein n=1 Tax=Croceitalea dokdonensis DOKDO 023 TaxID=1300341 RepID=A0A0P7AGR4_9FLAO|nr:Hypothetical protein I595_2419 [Croceitalea dokdonensis DOKDO 023]
MDALSLALPLSGKVNLMGMRNTEEANYLQSYFLFLSSNHLQTHRISTL